MGIISDIVNAVVGDSTQKPPAQATQFAIDNPATPFLYNIQGGVPVGGELVVHGTAYSGPAKGFSVNYLGAGDDVALHVNPRFKFLDHQVVMNSYQWGKWQKEERHPNRLEACSEFRLRIVNRERDFMFEVNDKHLGYFKHRADPRQIRAVEVKGDVTIHGVRFYNFGGHVGGGSAPMPNSGSSSSFQPPPPGGYPPQPQQQQWGTPQPSATNYYGAPQEPTPNVGGSYTPAPQQAPYPTPSSGPGFGGSSAPLPYPAAPGVYPNLGGGSVGFSTYESAPSGNSTYQPATAPGFNNAACAECGGVGRPYGCSFCHRYS